MYHGLLEASFRSNKLSAFAIWPVMFDAWWNIAKVKNKKLDISIDDIFEIYYLYGLFGLIAIYGMQSLRVCLV